MAALTFEEITGRIKAELSYAVEAADADARVPFVRVKPDALAQLASFLQREPALAFDFLMYITAVDWPDDDKLTLVYHYFSYEHEHSLMVKADVPRQGAEVPTVSHLYAAADWLEREVYDLFGVRFAGHPNMTRILTPENFTGHPLLKDFKNEDYVPFPE
jgi:NADH-quinone oxidoreductase subunit C